MMQLFPQFFPSGCSVLLAFKFSQRRPRVERNLVATSKLVPTLVVKAQHTSGIYHIERVAASLKTPTGVNTHCRIIRPPGNKRPARAASVEQFARPGEGTRAYARVKGGRRLNHPAPISM